ncbi:hypothetical protein DFH11DRAFT_1593151 [Phellopilus nigrolimitatus]|nr:hypothetical protein DFH11DRAFT_1593151 [Phellopilus nigrolimitatus]
MSGENIQGEAEITHSSPPRISGHPSIEECDAPAQRRSGSMAFPHSSVQYEPEVHSMSENALDLHGLADYSEADGTVYASSDLHLQAGVPEELNGCPEDGEIYQNSDSNSSVTAFSSQSYHQFPAALPMESATSTSLSEYRLKAPESVVRFTPPEDWLLDETIPPQSIRNIVVSVSGTAAFPNAWFDGKYEGKRARVLSVLNTSKLETSLALVTMLDSHSGYLSELRIPVRFLVPVPPEAIGDEIVVLRVPPEKIQELSEHVGTRWEVRALGLREDDADEDASDGAGDLVELDSEIGQMRLHRSCLALYSP